ncbi:MAG: ATP-dependent Clp protease proteolytic subunit [Pirellulales bacterium]
MSTPDMFWDVRAQAREATLDLFGVIGDLSVMQESVTASDCLRALRGLGRSITTLNVNLHSEGGSVADGLAIYRGIRDFAGEKIVHVTARAWSIASVVMLAGDRIEVAPEATVGIHDPMLLPFKPMNERDMVEAAAFLKGSKELILNVYERRTGTAREHLSELMSKTTFFQGGDEIKEAGFADVVKKDLPKLRVAACIDQRFVDCLKVPESIIRPKPAPLAPEIAARVQKLGIGTSADAK